MKAMLRWAAAIAAAAAFMGMAAPAQAQFCSSDTACGASSRCVDWFLWIKRCEFFRCNADLDCPTDRACLNGLCTRTACNDTGDCPRGTCIGGVCRRPAPPAPPPPTTGANPGGQGAKCGKIVENGVTRVYAACRTGFQCRQNRCTRPEQ